jgi:hypothetical protein
MTKLEKRIILEKVRDWSLSIESAIEILTAEVRADEYRKTKETGWTSSPVILRR